MRRFALSLLILCCLPALTFAQSVRAVVDSNQVVMGESLALRVAIEGGSGQVDVTPIKDFTVLSRGTSSKTQFINGRTSRELIYNFALVPLKPGDLQIPALPVRINSEIHYTQAIRVRAVDQPRTDTGKSDVFVTATVSETTPYEGQQFQYIFRFHNAVEVANAQFQKPEFKGFEAKEIKDRNSGRKIINGREYVVTELVFILIPLSPGKKTIDPAVLQCGIVQQTHETGTPFSGMDAFFNRRRVRAKIFRTKPVSVTIKPLPIATGSGFSNLVGTFDIQADLDAHTLAAGDSTTLSVTIKGNGNIRDADLPDILLPDGLKTYTDNPEEDVRLDRRGYHGKKVFRTAIVPVNPGEFVIPGVRLTYFDIETKAYATRETPAFNITVHPSADADSPLQVYKADKPGKRSLKKKVAFTGRDILPLKEDLSALESVSPLSILYFLMWIALPALGCMGIVMFNRSRGKKIDPASIMAQRAKKALARAKQANTSGDMLLSMLYRALVSSILSKAGIVGEAITWSEAEKQLLNCGCDMETARSCAKLLEIIESCNYSGECPDDTASTELLKQTEQMIKELAG